MMEEAAGVVGAEGQGSPSAVPSIAAAIVMAVALTVLVGWSLGVEPVQGALFDWPSVKPNAAVFLIVLAMGILCLRPGGSRRRQDAGRIIGLAASAFGVVLVAEHIFGGIGIDQLLFTDHSSAAGRPYIAAALEFVFAGLALAAIDLDPPRYRPATVLLMATGAVGLAVLVGYLYGVEYLQAFSNGIGIAPVALFSFLALVIGLAFLRPDRGIVGFLRGDDMGAEIARRLAPIGLGVPLALGFIRLSAQDSGLLGTHDGTAILVLTMVAIFLAATAIVAVQMRGLDSERRGLVRRAERQARFSGQLLEAAPDGMVIVDQQGRIVLVNHQAERLFGYGRVELLGEPVETLIPEALRPRHADHRDGFARTPHARAMGAGLDLWALRKDGTRFPVEISLSPLEAEQGMLVTAAVRDVSARTEAERALRESERQLQAAQALAHVGSWQMDIATQTMVRSDEYCRIFGLEPGAPPSAVVRERVHADDRALTDEVLRRAAVDLEPFSVEYRIVRPNGEVRTVLGQGQVIAGDDGVPARMFGAVQDITEQKAAQEARREAEERFRRAFEDSATGMGLVGIHGEERGRFLEVNEALCETTGYAEGELRGSRAIDLVHPDEMPRLRARIHDLVSGGANRYQGEHRLIGSGGSQRWAALSVSLVGNAAGDPVHAVVHINDVTERKRFEGQLEYLADHDSLTGMFNRRRFERELERELAAAGRYGPGGAVVVIDIDNFKRVNDSLGHAAGDALLASVSRALTGRLRATDTVARMGGDEFGVMLPHASRADAVAVTESLCETIRSQVLVDARTGAGRVTASAGITLFGGGDSTPTVLGADDLIVEADVAMYEAKETGRDRVMVHDGELDRRSRMKEHVSWVERIRQTLAEDRFTLYAQPILPLGEDDRRPRHELLIRMIDPTGDVVPPGTFLYIAERFDLIQEIDRWVISESARLLAEQQAQGTDVVLEINLSPKTLADPNLVDFITGELAETGADPRGLCFELTETEAIVNIDRAHEFASRLRTLGCTFAIDDFGAGFASFYYLKHLDFDYLKIDGEFIQNLPQSPTDQLVVSAVVAIARGMGKRTIAEFVSSRETVDLLRKLGVDFAQGFHVAKPSALRDTPLGQPVTLA
jgi:diguanylate cyclase (GGDEF)-like protein/PAS domain S-box-containing protein